MNSNYAKVARYFFGDGIPYTPEGSTKDDIEAIKKLVLFRDNPYDNPITFLSCTDKTSEVEWMKDLEEVSPFVAEFDDFKEESSEVLGDQGKHIRFHTACTWSEVLLLQ